jgi:hypothetical protein
MAAIGEALGDFATRVRGYFRDAARWTGRKARGAGSDLATVIEERPPLELPEVEFPYRIPTREEPIALALFIVMCLGIALTVSVLPAAALLYGHAPRALLVAVGLAAVIVGAIANLDIVGRALEEESTQLLRPLVSTGVPVLHQLHYWLNPLLAVLVTAFAIFHRSNNLLMLAAAVVLVAWALMGLMIKLPRDSPWNGPMLHKWAGRLHRTPFVYIAVIAFVFISIATDIVYG